MIGQERGAGQPVEVAHAARRDRLLPLGHLRQHERPAHADAVGKPAYQPGAEQRDDQASIADRDGRAMSQPAADDLLKGGLLIQGLVPRPPLSRLIPTMPLICIKAPDAASQHD